MLGKGAASDTALAHAAAEGDEDAFASIFERHLPAVFETAWRVLNDRGAAAEVTYETFAAAWLYRDGFRAERWAESLLESTHHRAQAWLVANPAAVPQASRPDQAASPPNLGPMLRNRIVSALSAQGVPTGRDESPVTDPEGRHLAASPGRRGRLAGLGGLGGLLAGSRARLAVGAAAVTVVVIGAVGIGFMRSGSDGAGDDDVETGPPRPDDPPGATTVTTARRSSTKASVTTTAPSTSTTASSTTTTTEPEVTTTQAPTTTTTQAPPPPSTTTTRPPSPAPRIVSFTGNFHDYDGDRCGRSEELLSIRWTTENATTGRIRRDGSNWFPLQQLPNGGFDLCSQYGTRWYLEVSNAVGTDDASVVPS